MQKILIDTDPGEDIDDLLATWFALRRPELDVRAITTVSWPSDGRARLVKRLLRYLGRGDIPVAAGMQYPLRPLGEDQRRRQHDLSITMNHASFAEPHDPADDPGDADAVDLIIRTVRQNPGAVALACIAPLTNIAAALCRAPDIAGLIQYIALMGGEVAQQRVEHNIATDAAASEIVFRSGIPLTMGTWSVTRQFTLTMDDCKVFDDHPSALCQALGRAIVRWQPAQSWKPGPVMYDLFPMIWAFDRSLYTVQEMPIRIETQGAFTRGMTVVGGDGTPVRVTTGIDVQGVRELYLKTVLS